MKDAEAVRYRVIGMDCASDAAEIEQVAKRIEGVERVKVSTASQIMTVAVDDPAARLATVEDAVTGLGYKLSVVPGSGSSSGDDETPDLTHATPAYRRALWIVVLLNSADRAHVSVTPSGGSKKGSISVIPAMESGISLARARMIVGDHPEGARTPNASRFCSGWYRPETTPSTSSNLRRGGAAMLAVTFGIVAYISLLGVFINKVAPLE